MTADLAENPARKSHIWRYFAFAACVGIFALSFVNASWLAASPTGTLKLIAHRGVYQNYDHGGGLQTCTASTIENPQHTLLENTLPSLKSAHSLGAGMVELDIALTKDGEIVVFGDRTLDCRTDGTGDTRDLTLAQIKALDAGYGYTADGGKTFPFRGKGVGMIPTLEQFLTRAGRRPLLFHFNSSDPAEADALAAALKAAKRDPVKRGDGFYGGVEEGPVARMREIYPEAWVFSRQSAEECSNAYAVQGWLGFTPSACKNDTLMVPLDGQWAFAGWPNKTSARMEAVGARIIMLGPQNGTDATAPHGIDLPEQIGEVPSSFKGYLWVEDIWNIGPALFPSVDRRRPFEQEAAEHTLEKRRDKRRQTQ